MLLTLYKQNIIYHWTINEIKKKQELVILKYVHVLAVLKIELEQLERLRSEDTPRRPV